MTISTGQFAGRRREMSRLASNCLCVGTNLSWLACRRMSMVVLGCESVDCVLRGEFSHAGWMKMTSSEQGDDVEEEIA
jgi:hypothetical protein